MSEEEQIESLKRWWKDYGTVVIVVCVLLGAGFLGWNQYQKHKESQAREGSELFQRFVVAAEQIEGQEPSSADNAQINSLADQLSDDYDGTLYADFARLHLAKVAVQRGEVQRARDLLQSVTDKGVNEEVKALARLRLGRVMAEQGEAEAAIAALGSNVPTAFASVYAEARGDILLAEKRFAEARTAYQAALQELADPRSPRRSLMQLKIDNTRTASDDPEVLPSPHAPLGNPHGGVTPVDTKTAEGGA